MALARYVAARFGVKTRAVPNPVTASVSQGVTTIAQNNPDRLSLLVINLSGANLYLGFFPDVSDTKGILLAASGGMAVFSAEEDGELVGYEFLIYSGEEEDQPIFVLEMEAE